MAIRPRAALLDHPAFKDLFTAEHHSLRQAAKEYFSAAELTSWVREPRGFLEKSQWRQFGELGFLGISLPREQGGRGLGLLGALIMNEAMADLHDLGMTLGMHCQNEITATWLATAQHQELRDKFVPEMIAGRLVGCACDTEPGGKIEATAIPDGDELVLSGRKVFIVNGYNADLCFVTVRLEGELATVLVEKDRAGVQVLKVFDKLGTRGIDSAMLEFDEVRVPAINVALKRGVKQSMHWNKVMTTARFLMCADACFTHGMLLDRILEYGRERMLDGVPLASWPINRRAIARAAIDLELMQAGLISRFGRLSRKRNAVAEVAALKWFCVERASSFAAFCAELEGGAGYMHDSFFLFAYTQLRGLKMAGGSSTTMKTIADQSLTYQEEIQALI